MIKVYTPKEKNNRRNLIYMARPKSKDPKTERISVRCTKEEKRLILEKAEMTVMSPSEYLRALGMNYPIYSRVSWQAVQLFVKAAKDQSRIGGILKYYLVNTKEKETYLGSKSRQEIEEILEATETRGEELLQIAKGVLRDCQTG